MADAPNPTLPSRQRGWRLIVKRLFDRVVAFLALIVLSPVLLVLAMVVLISMGWPVFFRQQRPGFRGHPFRVVKFRTMNQARDASGHLLPDAQRLTSVGKFLRHTSLDELPQFWNVLLGQLSLVGPRPLLMQYLPRYSPEQARRHDVLPGITGWAQINGRNDLPWSQKFALDVWYVDHWSLGLDARILLKSFWQVLKREGVSRQGYATTVEFMGDEAPEPSAPPVEHAARKP
ncbi:MAG TPA: sugar transferase [Terriglobales bacterium]|jgi:lipopolysaccharide/colanic/teichoic acid biosynthesis glycosyltransferase|nr:sugar transferase [Terriglobales bacterium]